MSLSAIDAILDTAKELWDEQDSLDHDLVDGSFYWRHCRWGLVQDLLDITVGRGDDAPRPFSIDEYNTVASRFHRIEEKDPAVVSWLFDDIAPRMRDALTSWTGGKPVLIPHYHFGSLKEAGTGRWLSIGVRNSQWTGDDLERVCRESERRFQNNNRDWIADARAAEREGQAFVGVDFTFYEAGHLKFESGWDELTPDRSFRQRWVAVESPVLMCTIPYPFPPEGVIAWIYDAIARGQHRWHERLYGHVAGDQRVATSIRTWTIGLLISSGLKFREAERLVAERLRTEISQPGFNQDRTALIRRVPEAEAYLFQKPRRNR